MESSSIFNSIFLARGDSGGHNGNLIYRCTQLIVLGLRVLSARGGSIRAPFIRGKGSRLRCFER